MFFKVPSAIALGVVLFRVNAAPAPGPVSNSYKYVFVVSPDGLHASDIPKYVAARPSSNISMLLQTGYEYTDACTSAPSDSFPGTVAQFTGGGPRTTGVWYVWVRNLYPIGSNCTGPVGTDTDSTEDLDYNKTLLFSGGINPANLPLWIQNGKCVPQYPHSRLRVNTVFEVIKSKGFQTAYTDKHPAYDIVRGPSGQGLSTGYFPEIESIPGSNVSATIAYDRLHLNAFLDWLDAKTPEHSEGNLTKVPALFAGNFQAVNVGQKVDNGGYQNTTGFPFTPILLQAIDSIDANIGAVVNKLKTKGFYNDTLIIVAAKHGNAPINPAIYGKVDPTEIVNATDVPVQWATSDDIALIFLNETSDTSKAVANLNANKSAGAILNIYAGQQLVTDEFADEAAPTDPAVPDIIVQPDLGIIYTTSTKKIAEHGGLSSDDRNTALFVSSPRLAKKRFTQRLNTTQIAPTIVQALGFNASELQAVVAEGGIALPGFDFVVGSGSGEW